MLRRAYDRMDYQLTEVTDKLSVPTAMPAQFDYESPPGVTDAFEIERRFEDSDFAFVDVHAENGEAWYEFSVGGKVYDESTNEFCRLDVSTSFVTVFKKSEELSFETFQNVVGFVEETLETTLVCEGDDS